MLCNHDLGLRDEFCKAETVVEGLPRKNGWHRSVVVCVLIELLHDLPHSDVVQYNVFPKCVGKIWG